MDDKPKTALDWIHWAQKQKQETNAAPPAAKPPAKPPASPKKDDATSAPRQRVEVAPAASAEPVVSEQAPVQEPPALPTDETVDETAGRAIDEDLEGCQDLPDLDDFDRLMAEAPAIESSDSPAPTPQAVEPQLPAASNSTVVIPAYSVYAFAASDFNFIEADGRELTYVEIIALAGDGSLRFDHSGITMGQKIAKADIDAGMLTFIPETDHSGGSHDSFLYKVHDGKSCSRVAYTMTIKAQPVDD